MKRTTRGFLSASAVLILGGGAALYTWRTENTIRPEKERQQREAKRLFQFGRIHVSSGTIKSHAETIAFERATENTWRLTAPIRWLARPMTIEHALDEVSSLRWESIIAESPSELELKEYGLSPPQASVHFETDRGPIQLWVGVKNEMVNRYPVMTNDRKVIGLVRSTLGGIFEKTLHDFGDLRIFPYPESQIREVAITKDHTLLFHLRRIKDAPWTVSGPEGPEATAHPARTHALLAALLRKTRMERLLKTKTPLAPPLFQISVTLEDGRTLQAQVEKPGDAQPWAQAELQGYRVELPRQLVQEIDQTLVYFLGQT